MSNEILNLGIACLDIIAQTIDTFPPPGGLELFDKLSVTTGGCAVNSAIDLAKMGIANSLMVKVGDDMLGDFVIAEANKYGIDTRSCRKDPQSNTSFTFVMVEGTGERRFFHTMGANATFRADEIDLEFAARHKFCCVGGVMIMPAMDGHPLAGVLDRLRGRNVTTILDTVFVDQPDRWQEVIFPMLPHLDYFVPSEKGAQAITGQTDPRQIAETLKDHGAINVVVKLGKKGIYYSTDKGENDLVPAYEVDPVVDTTGAGDAWNAGFLAGLSLAMEVPEACRLGNATAAFCIQAPGASTGVATLEQIRAFQAENR